MRIVYKNEDNTICVVVASHESLKAHTLDDLAKKDVPDGLPYWIVDETEFPTDRTFRNAWEIQEDWGPPDGYGSEFCTFEEIEDAQD